jgi:hypothetical protein
MVSANRVASGSWGVDRGVVEVSKAPPNLRRLVFGEQHAEPFSYAPGGADLVGRIMIIEHPAEPLPLLGGQVFGGGEQQPPVHPDGIGDRAAATEQVPGDALPDLGDHVVSERDQVPLVHCDLDVRQSGADPGGIRRRRVDHHDLDRVPELLGLLAQPLPHTSSGAARSQPQQRSRPIPRAVDEAGQPRIGPLPSDLVQDPADRPESCLIHP